MTDDDYEELMGRVEEVAAEVAAGWHLFYMTTAQKDGEHAP